jgi:YD repeat-containing protein
VLRRVGAVLVLVGACSGVPTTPVSNRAASSPPVPVEGVCPSLMAFATYDHMPFVPWAHELFPGCSPAPFDYDFSVCVGSCPRPCRQTLLNIDVTQLATYRYDDAGRWVETISNDKPAQVMNPGSATYRNGRLATTHLTYNGNPTFAPGGTWTISRDTNGRIVAVVDPNGTSTAVTWSADGTLVIALGGGPRDRSELRYDARKRLVGQGAKTTWSYRDDGRVSERHDEDGRTTYSYDERGRLIAVDFEWDPDSPYSDIHSHRSLDYDGRDRLLHETEIQTSTDAGEQSRLPSTYEYDCAPAEARIH